MTGLAQSYLVRRPGPRAETARLASRGRSRSMKQRRGGRDDARVNVKVVLSGLWVSMLFVFAYVDIFGSGELT